jgi:malate dehydrogenase (oxaloacetate-decarboxylating)
MCEAEPADLLAWTDGHALVATGSLFAPVTQNGHTYRIPQSNNALIFPGLGVTVARASRITDNMISAASTAFAELADPTAPGEPLLPLMDDLRTVAATAVDNPVQQVTEAMWRIDYPDMDIIDA